MKIGLDLNLPERLKFPERRIPTPFGKVGLPNKALLPRLRAIELDDRKQRAVVQAIAMDLALIPAAVPVVGDLLADFLESLHMSELRDILTPEEFSLYVRSYEKVSGPKTLGVLRTFMERGS